MRFMAIRDGVRFVAVRDGIRYIAIRESNNLYFTITFKDYDGTILSTQQVAYGEVPTAPTTPERTDDYVFTGWDDVVRRATTDKTYTAMYSLLEEQTIDLTSGTYYLEIPAGVKVIKVIATATGYDYGGNTYSASASVSCNGVTWASASATGDKTSKKIVYVGVTGGTTYSLTVKISSQYVATASASITWSSEINKQTPTKTAY